MILLESKRANQIKDKNDVFDIIGTENPSEKALRTCGELGHKA